MKRRQFFLTGLTALSSGVLADLTARAKSIGLAVDQSDTDQIPPVSVTCEGIEAGPQDMRVRFLGTGAAGWNPETSVRRNSSIIVDNAFFIDLTVSVLDMIPQDCHASTVFYTHSHGDHFQPVPALKRGIKTVYLSESWITRGREMFEKASQETGLPIPQILPLSIGDKIQIGEVSVTALPANHATFDMHEQSLIFLLEKGKSARQITPEAESRFGNAAVRVLYATDTAGIMGRASFLSGIDYHVKKGVPITGLIMEATMGVGEKWEKDVRYFNHSSINTIKRTETVLAGLGRYTPPEGQPVYVTHMSYGCHDCMSLEEMKKAFPSPLKPAEDGLEVVFRAN